jgi:GT2 family glycosyltransferase
MISIIIPNFNGVHNLKELFNSLYNQTYRDFKVVLVDNGSTDDSLKYISENYSDTNIIKLDKNYGFVRAINEGIKYSLNNLKSEYILLLNNDIELKENFLEKGIKTFEDVKEADFLAVKMLNFFHHYIIDDTGDFIRKTGGVPMARGHGEKDTGQYNEAKFIFGACAGAAFYKPVLFKEAGFFDEDFFAYLEDVDLSFRFQLQGYKCYYNPEIVCYHKRRETTNKFEGWETYYSEKNLIALRIKNFPFMLYLKYSPLFLLARVSRYYKFFMHYPKGTFKFAFKGYLKGLSEIPKSLCKRRKIQKIKKVSNKYLENLF